MAVTTDNLLIEVKADVNNATKSLEVLTTQLLSLKQSLTATSKSTKGTESAVTDLGFSAFKLNAIIDLGKKVWSTLSAPVEMVTAAYIEQDKANNKLANSLKLVGQLTEAHKKSFFDFADSLQESTNTASELTLELAAIAKTSGLTDAQTKKLITTSLDLAAVTGQDVGGAFRELMGQYAGVSGRLTSKLIPELEALTTAQIKSGAGIDLVASKVRGFAENEAKSLAGSIAGVKVSFGELAEDIGKFLIEVVRLPSLLNSAKSAIEASRVAIAGLSTALFSIDWVKVASGIAAMAAAFVALQAAIKLIAIVELVSSLGLLYTATAYLSGILATATAALAKFWAAAAPFLSTAAIVAGVVAFGLALEVVIRNFDKLGKIGAIVIDSLNIGFLKVGSTIKGLIGGLFGNNEVDQNAKKIEDALARIKQNATDIDFGFAGEVTKLITGTTAETKNAASATKDWADKQRAIIMNADEQLKLLSDIGAANATLANDINNIGASQITQIENGLKLELEKLAIKREQLKLENKLSTEVAANLDKQEALLKQKAGKQIEQVRSPNLVSPDQLQSIKDTFGEGAEGFASSVGGAMGAVSGALGGAMSAINGVLDFAQQLIDFIPQVLSKIANIFNSLTELPLKIVQGVKDVFKSIVRFISEFIPNLVQAIPDLLDTIATAIFEKIPDAIIKLVDSFPAIVDKFIARVPELAEKFIVGIVAGAPRLAIGMNMAIIKAIPQLVKSMTIELPKAFVRGALEAVKVLFSMLGSLLKGKLPSIGVDEKGITNSIKNIGKMLTGAASQLFNISDLAEGATGLADPVKEAGKMAQDILDEFGSILQHWLNVLIDIWRKIYDIFLKPWVDLILGAFALVDEIFKKLAGYVSAAWGWVVDNILSPLASAVSTAFGWVIDNILNPLAGVVSGAFGWVITNVIDPILDAITGLGNIKFPSLAEMRTLGWNIGVGLFDKLADMTRDFLTLGGKIATGIWDKLVSIDWSKIFNIKIDIPGAGGSTSTIKKVLSAAGLAEGGPVYAQAGMLMQPRGTDTVPAMLTPGEFVINRGAVNSLGMNAMNAINKGQSPVQNFNYSIEMKIDTKEAVDENFIRNRLMPRLKEELRRASVDGQTVIFGAGVR